MEKTYNRIINKKYKSKFSTRAEDEELWRCERKLKHSSVSVSIFLAWMSLCGLTTLNRSWQDLYLNTDSVSAACVPMLECKPQQLLQEPKLHWQVVPDEERAAVLPVQSWNMVGSAEDSHLKEQISSDIPATYRQNDADCYDHTNKGSTVFVRL